MLDKLITWAVCSAIIYVMLSYRLWSVKRSNRVRASLHRLYKRMARKEQLIRAVSGGPK